MGVSVQPLPSPIGAPALTLLLFPVGCLPDYSDNHTPHVPTSHFPPARCGGGGDGDQTIEIQYPFGISPVQLPRSHLVTNRPTGNIGK